MFISLNNEQAKGPANFFFDVTKGLVLGAVGFAVISQIARLEVRLIYGILSLALAYGCIKLALTLLE